MSLSVYVCVDTCIHTCIHIQNHIDIFISIFINKFDFYVNACFYIQGYDFGDAGRQIYEFLWDEYADWYIEVSKTRMREGGDLKKAQASRRVLVYVWDTNLRLLHPFMPFLTGTYIYVYEYIIIYEISFCVFIYCVYLYLYICTCMRILLYIWDTNIRLSHPFMPFLTGMYVYA